MKLFPEKYTFWKIMGHAFNYIENLDKALFCFKEYLKNKPNSDEVWNSIGLIHFEKGQILDALAAYENALKINPCKLNYHYIADLHLNTQDYSKALKMYEFMVKEWECDCGFADWYQLGFLYNITDQDNRAIEAFLAAFKRTYGEHRREAFIIGKLAAIYIKHGWYAKAFNLLSPFIRDKPHYAIYNDYIELLHGVRDENIKTLRKCLKWFKINNNFGKTPEPDESELKKIGWFKRLNNVGKKETRLKFVQ